MRVTYYTQPQFLDTALPRIKELSKLVELHVILEIAPDTWTSGIFDGARALTTPSPVTDADTAFASSADRLRAYWSETATFKVVVHSSERSIHPNSWVVSRLARRLIASNQSDLIHLDDIGLRTAWALLGKRLAPIVLTIHDPAPHFGEANWRTELARTLVRPYCQRVIIHNNRQRGVAASRLKVDDQAIDAIPLGVLDIFATAWRGSEDDGDDGRTILFFGRQSKYKGIQVFYEAAESLAKRVPNLRFIVAGRSVGGYRLPDPPKLANDCTIDIINRYISNQELAHLFARATVVSCPYLEATQSGVVLTAYAFGKPVVATDVGGLPEYVKDGRTGFVVPCDAESFANGLLRVLTAGPHFFRQNIDRLKNGELSWRRIALDTVKVYERTLADNS